MDRGGGIENPGREIVYVGEKQAGYFGIPLKPGLSASPFQPLSMMFPIPGRGHK